MFIIILLTTVLAAAIAHQWLKRSKLPPGPFPLPLIGNIHQLSWRMMKTGGFVATLRQFKEEYGSVFTLWIGPLATVHLGELAVAQETMVKQGSKFQYRWVPAAMDYGRNGKGMIAAPDASGLEQRKFSLHAFRNLGMSRNIMEERIMMEIDLRCKDIENSLSKGSNLINPYDLYDLMVGSIINRMLFSDRFDEKNEKEFFQVKHALDEMVENASALDMFAVKYLSNVPIIGERYRTLMTPLFTLKEFLRRQVKQRIAEIENGTHVIDGEGTDYADAYLLKMREEEDNPNTLFDEEMLVINLLDLWFAGQETTASTLLWAMVFLLNHPENMTKIREEVSRVTKNERSLSMQDKAETPHLVATITEIQRLGSILNMNLFRQSHEDTVVGGFPVPKGTPIAAQISLIMSDEKNIKEPEKFRPSRFLSGDRLDQHVIPFGIGKRACLGESLARAELYLILGNLLHRFEILPDGGLPDMRTLTATQMMNRTKRFTMRMNKIRH